MSWSEDTTIEEARKKISSFLQETGCYDICAQCPVYPDGEGCCHGCGKLTRVKSGKITGCGQPNLSCLTYTCSVLDRHLLEINRFKEFNDMIYGIQREGYRGCEPRNGQELLQISDPLQEIKTTIEVNSKEYFLSFEGGKKE